MQPCPLLTEWLYERQSHPKDSQTYATYERTKRSRLSHWGFLGLNFRKRLKRTWATGAMPLSGVSDFWSGIGGQASYCRRGALHWGTRVARVGVGGRIGLESKQFVSYCSF